MDFQTRFALFTAVGIASFSAGLSLTTACSRSSAAPERLEARALPAPAPQAVPSPPAAIPSPQPSPAPSEPVSKPRTETAKQELAAGELRVRRLVPTHAVDAREPAEPALLQPGMPVLAFMELENRASVERHVIVTFEHPGRPAVGHVRLRVPAQAPRFRTWARTRNLSQPGTWQAVVRAEDGTELGRQPFELSKVNES